MQLIREYQNGFFLDNDGVPRNIIDPEGGIAIFEEHTHAIHMGESFGFDGDGSIAAGESVLFLGKVGAKQVHFDAFNGQFSAGEIKIELFEAPTITADGTLQAPYRLNRAVANTNTMGLFSAPTVSANGSKIGGVFLPASGGGAHINPAAGGVSSGRVLTQNTNYLFKVTNTGATTAISYGIVFGWHESDVILA
jgi:hypothetical protein